MCDLKFDEEFCALKYPVDKASYDALEADIYENGCKTPIVIWNDIIIDGQKRYEICKKWDLPFQTQRMEFKNRQEAIEWICKDQLQRTDLPEETRKYLIGKYYEAAKEKHVVKHGATASGSNSRGYQYKLAELISREVNLVPGTVYKYGIYTRALDSISSKNKNIAEKILSGRFKISQANIVELSRLPEDELFALNKRLTENNMDHITYAEIRQELNRQYLPSASSGSNDGEEDQVLVKELPKYDPDAEISSLALTIPSWISSIKRAQSLSDFDKTTKPARERLLHELFALHKAVYTIQKSIEEVNHDG